MEIEKKVKIIEEFYGSCAEILGTEHEFRDHVPRPRMSRTGEIYTPDTSHTRWNRPLGNGRFPGYGSIRLFWPDTVIFSLTKPKTVTKTINGREKALEFLREVVKNG